MLLILFVSQLCAANRILRDYNETHSVGTLLKETFFSDNQGSSTVDKQDIEKLIEKLKTTKENDTRAGLRERFEWDIDIYRVLPNTIKGSFNAPCYTASVDAAMTLVPNGWIMGLNELDIDENGDALESGEDHRWVASLHIIIDKENVERAHGYHTNPAIALCIAALRAHIVQQEMEA